MFLSNNLNPKFIVCLVATALAFESNNVLAETQDIEFKDKSQHQISQNTISESETVKEIQQMESSSTESTHVDVEKHNQDYLIVYNPPVRGGETERIPTTARGGDCPRFKGDEDFALHTLAPTHLAQTTKAQPILYWSVSKPVSAKFAFTIEEEYISGKKIPTQLVDDKMIDLSVDAGIHSFSLSEYNVVLQEGVEYNWFVSLICDVDRRSLDIVAGGRIIRISPSAHFSNQEKQMSHEKLPHLYAENSLWYDALESLAQWIQKKRDDSMPRQLRADLLHQVQLSEITVHDKIQ